MYHHLKAVFATLACSCVAFMGTACRCDRVGENPDNPTATSEPEPTARLVFPASVETADESVNEFVRRAMTTCASGDYDAFRLLWTAREDPLPRAEFERGWQAVQEIRVRALEKVRLPLPDEAGGGATETLYAVCAEVRFDPLRKASGGEPQRQAVSLIVREHDEWRLAGAPKPVRRWMRDRADRATPASPSEAEQGPPIRNSGD